MKSIMGFAMNSSIREWRSAVDRWKTNAPKIKHLPSPKHRPTIHYAIHELDIVILGLIRLRAYLDWRSRGLVGVDAGHDAAVRGSNHLVFKARKILGYNAQIRDDVNF
jgi:hypothetical protein